MTVASPDRDARIVELYAGGLSLKQIAQRESMSASGVHALLLRCAVETRPARRQTRSDLDREVADRYRSGATMEEIAGALPLTLAQVKGALRREGVPARSRGGPGGGAPSTRATYADRRDVFAAEQAAGKSLAEIGREHGISRQAVHLVLKARPASA